MGLEANKLELGGSELHQALDQPVSIPPQDRESGGGLPCCVGPSDLVDKGAKQAKPNRLFYGDNLHVLREHVASKSIDLVYLDPPFNSNRSYNVLFKEKSGGESPAQIEAFGDTWI